MRKEKGGKEKEKKRYMYNIMVPLLKVGVALVAGNRYFLSLSY